MGLEEEVNEEMKKMAPDFPEKKTMDAPHGYFEKLPEQVLNRWRKEEPQQVTKKVMWRRIVGIAAVAIGLCLGTWWFFSKPSSPQTTAITSLEAYQYVHENIDEFENLLETEEIKTDEIQLDLPDEGIEEYLIDELEGSNPEDIF